MKRSAAPGSTIGTAAADGDEEERGDDDGAAPCAGRGGSRCFRNADGELLRFHRSYASMAEAQRQLQLNGYYMMLMVSVLLNLTEKWGLDHGKIANAEDGAYPRRACAPGGVLLCADTVLWYAYNPPAFAAVAIAVVYFLKYDSGAVVFASIACSAAVVGWEFPFLSNHSNLYVFVSLFTLLLFTPSAGNPGALGAMRRLLGSGVAVVYLLAGFHKLNSDFMRGCGVNFLLRFVDRFAPDAVRGALAELVRREAVYVPVNASILALELLSGALMFAPPVAWAAVAGAMLLHAVLSLISFYDFAAVALAVLYLIVPIAEHDRCAPRRARGRLPGPRRPRRWGGRILTAAAGRPSAPSGSGVTSGTSTRASCTTGSRASR